MTANTIPARWANEPAPRQPVNVRTLLSAWGRLLRGYSPLLSIEITRECPLRCPGCYAYDANHLLSLCRQLTWLAGRE